LGRVNAGVASCNAMDAEDRLRLIGVLSGSGADERNVILHEGRSK
jgi:hypothetical protein